MDKGNIDIDYCSFSSEISAMEDVNMEVISKANNSDISSMDLDEPCASGISNALFQHIPQCVLRQPFPPPLPAVTHIRNEDSEYHKHIMSKTGVPGRYGGHTSCMGISVKNYGCNSCVWYKWHGELHGYPDVDPSDFQNHLDSN